MSATAAAANLRSLRVAIVSHAPQPAVLGPTLTSLLAACAPQCAAAPDRRLGHVEIWLVNHGPDAGAWATLAQLVATMPVPAGCTLTICGDGSNPGFGAGHNRALAGSECALHLILNPDVELATEALTAALDFLDAHPDCGLLVPWVMNSLGEPEYLCKRYPSVLDLLLRGFAPGWLRRWFGARLARYELRDREETAVLWDPPIVSGCFMLFRTAVLKALGGFDPRYFLYFEDFDLSLRAARLTRIARVPAVRIVHHGGHAACKGWPHIRMFVRSGITFFNTHGWKLW